MAVVERWPLLGRRGVMTPLFFSVGGGGEEYDVFIVPRHAYCNL